MRMEKQKAQRKLRDTGYGLTLPEVLLVITMIALVGSVGGGLYMGGTYHKMLAEKAARDLFLSLIHI